MIDYGTYERIMKCLNKEDLDALKKLLDKEKNDYYLSIARKALNSYINNRTYKGYYGYNFNGNLVITNGISVYYFNSDEILTKYKKDELKYEKDGDSIKKRIVLAYDYLKKYEQEEKKEIRSITKKKYDGSILEITSEDESVTHCFYKHNFELAESFLGEKIEYQLLEDKPCCFAKSIKGKGLILGTKNSNN